MPASSTPSKLFEQFEKLCESFTKYLYFERTPVDQKEYKLERMRILLAACRNPQNSIPIIHIAGSKGKGSTTILIESLLSAGGYRTGRFTSPHIHHYRERFYVSNVPQIEYAHSLLEVTREAEHIGQTCTEKAGSPTMFELLTLTAFLLFERLQCDIAVIETGLGGRLDTTNVVDPILSVITHLELEHTEILGNTIESIAAEKAGIIKKKVPVISSKQEENARIVLEKRAKDMQSPWIYLPDICAISNLSIRKNGMEFSAHMKQLSQEHISHHTMFEHTTEHLSSPTTNHGTTEFDIHSPLLGEAHSKNICLALASLHILGAPLPQHTIQETLKNTHIPGRMQRIDYNLFVDAAHTPHSISNAIETMAIIAPEGFTVLLGCVEGKKSDQIALNIRHPSIHRVIITDPIIRASDAKNLIAECTKHFIIHEYIPEARDALKILKKHQSPILCIGSFFLLAAIADIIYPESISVSD